MKNYIRPAIEIKFFDQDVITSSGFDSNETKNIGEFTFFLGENNE